MSLRTVVALAEGSERELTRWLSESGELELVAETSTAHGALDALASERPDLLILSAELPDSSGFELVECIPPAMRPAVIFIAEHPRLAARAFDAGALDFLARPFKQERFQLALERAVARLGTALREELRSCLGELLQEVRTRRRNDDLLVVKSRGRGFTLVRESRIDWIDAARSYVRINTDGEVLVARETMQALQERLDETRFARIHRSTLVNLDRVTEVIIREHGDYSIVLENGQKLNLGRSYRHEFLKLLGRPLEPLGTRASAIA